MASPETLQLCGNSSFLLQNRMEVTLVVSRFTDAAETRYAPMEGKPQLLQMHWTNHCVLSWGAMILFAVNHRLLLKLFGDCSFITSHFEHSPTEPEGKNTAVHFFIWSTSQVFAIQATWHPIGSPQPMNLPDDVAATKGNNPVGDQDDVEESPVASASSFLCALQLK